MIHADNCPQWLKTQNLIPTLLSFLSPDHPASVQTSAGDFLKAIITISANATQNDQSCIGPNSLTRQLVSMPCVESLIKAMLQGGNPLTVGVGIVIEVIRKNNSDYDPENINGPDSLPTTYDPIYLGNLLRLFAKHIPDFMALIQSSKHTVNDGGKVRSVERGKLNSAWGAKIEPLGFDRFKTCELMAELLHCSNMGLLNEPGSDDYVRQRDAERERLMREGVFNPHREETSAFDGNDSTVDFVNGSVIGYGSPEGSRVLEVANTGEESFEDVSASGVLVDKEKDAEVKDTSSPETKAESAASSQQAPTETAENASNGTSEDGSDNENPASQARAQTPPSDPVSATASGIAEVSLGGGQTTKESQPAAEAASNGIEEQTTASSHAGTESAPLVDQQNNQQSSLTPDTAGQVGDASSSAPPASESAYAQPNDGDVPRQLHPDVQIDSNGQPVVGDYLKIMFVENRVVPTILVSPHANCVLRTVSD